MTCRISMMGPHTRTWENVGICRAARWALGLSIWMVIRCQAIQPHSGYGTATTKQWGNIQSSFRAFSPSASIDGLHSHDCNDSGTVSFSSRRLCSLWGIRGGAIADDDEEIPSYRSNKHAKKLSKKRKKMKKKASESSPSLQSTGRIQESKKRVKRRKKHAKIASASEGVASTVLAVGRGKVTTPPISPGKKKSKARKKSSGKRRKLSKKSVTQTSEPFTKKPSSMKFTTISSKKRKKKKKQTASTHISQLRKKVQKKKKKKRQTSSRLSVRNHQNENDKTVELRALNPSTYQQQEGGLKDHGHIVSSVPKVKKMKKMKKRRSNIRQESTLDTENPTIGKPTVAISQPTSTSQHEESKIIEDEEATLSQRRSTKKKKKKRSVDKKAMKPSSDSPDKNAVVSSSLDTFDQSSNNEAPGDNIKRKKKKRKQMHKSTISLDKDPSLKTDKGDKSTGSKKIKKKRKRKSSIAPDAVSDTTIDTFVDTVADVIDELSEAAASPSGKEATLSNHDSVEVANITSPDSHQTESGDQDSEIVEQSTIDDSYKHSEAEQPPVKQPEDDPVESNVEVPLVSVESLEDVEDAVTILEMDRIAASEEDTNSSKDEDAVSSDSTEEQEQEDVPISTPLVESISLGASPEGDQYASSQSAQYENIEVETTQQHDETGVEFPINETAIDEVDEIGINATTTKQPEPNLDHQLGSNRLSDEEGVSLLDESEISSLPDDIHSVHVWTSVTNDVDHVDSSNDLINECGEGISDDLNTGSSGIEDSASDSSVECSTLNVTGHREVSEENKIDLTEEEIEHHSSVAMGSTSRSEDEDDTTSDGVENDAESIRIIESSDEATINNDSYESIVDRNAGFFTLEGTEGNQNSASDKESEGGDMILNGDGYIHSTEETVHTEIVDVTSIVNQEGAESSGDDNIAAASDVEESSDAVEAVTDLEDDSDATQSEESVISLPSQSSSNECNDHMEPYVDEGKGSEDSTIEERKDVDDDALCADEGEMPSIQDYPDSDAEYDAHDSEHDVEKSDELDVSGYEVGSVQEGEDGQEDSLQSDTLVTSHLALDDDYDHIQTSLDMDDSNECDESSDDSDDSDGDQSDLDVHDVTDASDKDTCSIDVSDGEDKVDSNDSDDVSDDNSDGTVISTEIVDAEIVEEKESGLRAQESPKTMNLDSNKKVSESIIECIGTGGTVAPIADDVKPFDLKLSVITWNMAEMSPSEEEASFLKRFSLDEEGSDLILFGAQETEVTKPRRSEGRRSRELRRLMIKNFGKDYVPLALHGLGGVQLGLFCKKSLLEDIEYVKVVDVACGVGNVFHNKGAIGCFVKVKARNDSNAPDERNDSVSMLFVACHLAAQVKKLDARNSDFWRIVSEFEAQSPRDFLKNHGSSASEVPDGKRLMDSIDRIFFCGDLNYRVDLPREHVEQTITTSSTSESVLSGRKLEKKELQELLRHDQLLRTISEQKAFPGMVEAEITFNPTFKFDKGTNVYDTSAKKRVPSWTDRVLFKPFGVRALEYDSVQSSQSDHKPVYATFGVDLKSSLRQKKKRRRPQVVKSRKVKTKRKSPKKRSRKRKKSNE